MGLDVKRCYQLGHFSEGEFLLVLLQGGKIEDNCCQVKPCEHRMLLQVHRNI